MSDNLKMARFWMVWNPHGRARTSRHDSRASADTEAARLAARNPGAVFFVLKMVGGKAATINAPADITVTAAEPAAEKETDVEIPF